MALYPKLILDALATVRYPGTGKNLVEAEMVADNMRIDGMKVSFSHKRSPRRWNPNIQRIRILEGRTPRRRNVCTSCIKANKVRRAV